MSNPTKYYSNIQEHRVAEYLGWEVVVGSGATATRPGDIVSAQWLGECKTHIKQGNKVVFYRKHWDKIKKEATSKFKYPVLIVDDGTQDIEHTWCLVDYGKFCPYNAVLVDAGIRPTVESVSIPSDTKLPYYDACPIIMVSFVDSEMGEHLGILSLSDFCKYFSRM